MIRETVKRKDKAEIINCTFLHGTIFTPELKEAYFNKVVSFGVIHLLDNAQTEITTTTEMEKLIEQQGFPILESQKMFLGMTLSFIVAKKE